MNTLNFWVVVQLQQGVYNLPDSSIFCTYVHVLSTFSHCPVNIPGQIYAALE